MSFPRYPKYKDSGVEWIGLVPEHWSVQRMKLSVRICRNGIWGDEPQGNDDDVICVRVADFDRQSLQVRLGEPTIRNVSKTEQADRLLQNGNLLLEKSGGGEGQPVGCVVLYEGNSAAVCSNFVARMQLAECMNPSFWRYVHAAAYAMRINTRSIKQTSGIQNLDQQAYLDEPAAFPPADEQEAIATFLNQETAKIDDSIQEQQRMIELLKEKRQAVISHAVTKGLTPGVAMKHSGIEAIGDVPTHWRVEKVKRVARMESGHTPDKKVPDYWTNCDIPWVSLNDTGYLKDHEYISETAFSINPAGIANSSARLLPERTVVFSRDATIGRCAITTRPMAVSQHFIGWVCGPEIVPEFLLYRMRSMTQELERLTTGATLKTIGMPDVRTMVTPLPPSAEQKTITSHIRATTSALDSLLKQSEEAIALLYERRTALISAAVTGKVDVRNLTSPVEPLAAAAS